MIVLEDHSKSHAVLDDIAAARNESLDLVGLVHIEQCFLDEITAHVIIIIMIWLDSSYG